MVAVAGPLALGGCTVVGPDFASPDSAWAPKAFTGEAAPGASVPVAETPDPQWWRSLGDPVLIDLETRLAAANLDIRMAALRLAQARAALGVTKAGELPSVNVSARMTREQESRLGANKLVSFSRLDEPFDLYQAGFDASWEIDLWGRVKRGVEQAGAQAEQAAEALHGVQVTQAAELARDYVQLRGLLAKLAITRANLESARASLSLTRARAEGGVSNDLDVANAATLVASIEAAIPDEERQRDNLVNAIALLLGEVPGALGQSLVGPAAAPVVPARIPVGVPADLVRRRPDVREAEAALHAATAAVGLATADLYPRVTLGGNFAQQGLGAANLGDWLAKAYTFGPSVSLPLFDGGRLRATVALREAQQAEAGLLWRARFLTALHEVDDALTTLAGEQRRRDRLAVAALSARRALGIARDRYALGVADFLQVLTAQRAQLTAEQDLADSNTNVATSLVQLYKALGGGWSDAS